MAIVQALIAMLVRSFGKILNAAFGWATLLLFGKIPEDRQIYISLMGLLSLLWMVTVLGVALPGFGAFLLAFVWLPEWIDRSWIRLGMLLMALLLPLAVGGVSLFSRAPGHRPRGRRRLTAILKGYRFALGLAVTLAMMLIVALVLKARELLHWWMSMHIPVVVESQDYLTVVGQIQKALRNGGHETMRQQATILLRWPTRLLGLCLGGTLDNLIASELTTLRGAQFEVILHPFDLIVRGRKAKVNRLRMLLSEQLTFTDAHLTWSREAHEIEDALSRLWRQLQVESSSPTDAAGNLDDVARQVRDFEGTYAEWEVLFREMLQVEGAVTRAAAGIPEPSLLPR